MICHKLINGKCQVIEQLCGLKVFPHPSACEFCCNTNTKPNQNINLVTVSLAIDALSKNKKNEEVDLLIFKYGHFLIDYELQEKSKHRLEKILNGDGVGSCMWKILDSIGIKHTANCPCLDWAERMNAWGPDLCNKNRKQIIKHMKLSAKNYGWGDVARAIKKAIKNKLIYKLNPLDPFGSLLNEAIRIAIKKELIDIFIPLGPGSRYENIEIKYALRSIERYAIGWRKIWIVGTIPSFLHETDRIKLIQKKEYNHNKATRISRKVLWAFENLPMTNRIAFWNDDYLLINTIDVREILPYYRGTLMRKITHTSGGWHKTLNITANALLEAGLPARHYDIHVPILLDRNKFCALGEWWIRSRSAGGMGFVMKSIYGNNYYKDTPFTTRDRKIQGNWSRDMIRSMINNGRWLISYGDGALKTGLGTWMAEQFPEKCSAE